MEKFNITYKTVSGQAITNTEEYRDLSAAVDDKAKMFDFDSIDSGAYYTFGTEDGSTALINPKCIESVIIRPDHNG